MKLIEAVRLARPEAPEVPEGGRLRTFTLACGFTPLHLSTFLLAHLRQAFPQDGVRLSAGLYGDLPGTLERAADQGLDGVLVPLEWSDLDPRLDPRLLGGWTADDLADIAARVPTLLGRLERSIGRVVETCPVALAGPTLPLSPVALTPGWRLSEFEAALHAEVSAFLARVAGDRRVRVVAPSQLDRRSPHAARGDLGGFIATGFPYTLEHSDALAALLRACVEPQRAGKGIITDLDDTLWAGILGEEGVQGVHWDLEHGAQLHGLYQLLLSSLASAGFLVAVCSKNDPDLVERALARPDLQAGADVFFPVEAGWGPKSQAVGRILDAWNVGPDSVVFVDDSPMELAEVARAHPQIECLPFPKGDADAVMGLLRVLRDRFGADRVSDEDRIRARSLQSSQAFSAVESEGNDLESFLADAEATLELAFDGSAAEERAFELVNKTNQFNVNGARYTEADWSALVRGQGGFLCTVAYRDRFGPLGTIAVLAGRQVGSTLEVPVWVMSCRAFARRIEHQCLRQLFERFQVDEVVFEFKPTDRNGPLREFLSDLGLNSGNSGRLSLSRAGFDAHVPALHHSVTA